MNLAEVLEQVETNKIIPVVKIERAEDTSSLCNALEAGGLAIAEITFRTSAAAEAVRLACRQFPQMLIGAGTIVNVEQAKRAYDAGASFLVSPGFSRQVTEFAVEHKLAIFPGVCTPTEIMMAMEYDLPVMKFFPAKQSGGLDTIKAFAAAFPGTRFMPTGGIDTANIREYLSFSKIIACGGSWMVKDTLMKEGNYAEITRLTKEAVALVK